MTRSIHPTRVVPSIRALLLALLALLAFGACTYTTALPSDHPASPRAPVGRLAAAPPSLARDAVPAAGASESPDPHEPAEPATPADPARPADPPKPAPHHHH